MNTIEELIIQLQSIKEKHGNLPLLNEYDASYWIGYSLSIEETKKNPDTGEICKMLIIG